MAEAIEITREQANEIIAEQMKHPMRKTTICWKGRWWDIRELSEQEIENFITKIIQTEK